MKASCPAISVLFAAQKSVAICNMQSLAEFLKPIINLIALCHCFTIQSSHLQEIGIPMLTNRFIKQLFNSFLDLAPILAVILIFQVLIIRQPVPDVASLIIGTLFVIIGLYGLCFCPQRQYILAIGFCILSGFWRSRC
jgi:hypothetical protein